MASVQRALLYSTGPLCALHDSLSSGDKVSGEDVNNIIEQTLCLMGSANYLLSTLRRKKVLATINKDKIDLADYPLPNAKTMLFGDDFPTLASKQADLSKGLAKNLNKKPNRTGIRRPYKERPTINKQQSASSSFSKYQNSRSKNYSFRAQRGPKQESQDS